MKYVKQIGIIFGITLAGELLNQCLPLPVPAGVYGLFLLLTALCLKVIRVSDVEDVGNFLLDTMPMMFIPASVGLMEDVEAIRVIAIPLVVISVVSTLVVMVVTGKTAQWMIGKKSVSEKEAGNGE